MKIKFLRGLKLRSGRPFVRATHPTATALSPREQRALFFSVSASAVGKHECVRLASINAKLFADQTGANRGKSNLRVRIRQKLIFIRTVCRRRGEKVPSRRRDTSLSLSLSRCMRQKFGGRKLSAARKSIDFRRNHRKQSASDGREMDSFFSASHRELPVNIFALLCLFYDLII